MRHHRKLTDDERRQIIEARAGGTPAAALAHRFGVSPRTIYNTLSRAKGVRQGPTTTISTRLSARQLAGFQAALDRRGIIDQPAALRRLMGAADILLRPVDPVVRDHLQAWGAQVATEGTAVNQIARKLNEAKLRGRPIPFTDDDMTTIRTFAGGLVEFADAFRILWAAELAAKTREVDKALEGLAAEAPEP
ncbi:helix-turn-helix domain-containing protein [Dinoroseobacter sp. PD6]|uniref:helix-turn-helix domain-containing protein n=1 Tax=Dinoroseobacter sp. PD6 TaxID=3028384 RepID=UPI00237BB7FE|nr:helix-turn-helix domain-containing protein [Dinoroseobacter sp. PD6]MDD9715820.1 helix-turn-helix domain-containing protein [Dinoroseobacter sp. PD6]